MKAPEPAAIRKPETAARKAAAHPVERAVPRAQPMRQESGSPEGDDGLLDAADDVRVAVTIHAAEAPRAPASDRSPAATVADPPAPALRRMFAPGGEPAPVVLQAALPDLPQAASGHHQSDPSQTAIDFIEWLQQGLANRTLKYNETGALVHFTAEGMALVSPLVFRSYATDARGKDVARDYGMEVQREVIRAGWHVARSRKGHGRVNILRYQVIGRGGSAVGHLAALVLAEPYRWVLPVPAANPVLKLSDQR